LEQPAFRGLSENLMRELRLCAYRKLLLQAPFLQGQKKDVIAFIVGTLRDAIYLPADMIVRAGDIGRDLFFMRRGSASVFTGPNPPRWLGPGEVAVYTAGNYFGELAMLTGHPRAAWIMATSYCVVSVMPYSAVEALGNTFPGAFTTLVQAMIQQYQLKTSVSWERISQYLTEKLGFLCDEEAFQWFCERAGGNADDEQLGAKSFVEGLRRMKVPSLDRMILWAQMDRKNNGTVSFDEFSSMVIVDPVRWPPSSTVPIHNRLITPTTTMQELCHRTMTMRHFTHMSRAISSGDNIWESECESHGELPKTPASPATPLTSCHASPMLHRLQIPRQTSADESIGV